MKNLSHSQLLRQIVLTAIQKGNLDAKLKRYKYGSRNWKLAGDEYEAISMELVNLEAEYRRRFYQISDEELDL